MEFKEAIQIVLELLQSQDRVRNSDLIQALDGDERLLELVREELISTELAEDKEGVSLLYAGPRERSSKAPEPARPESLAEGASAPRRIFLSYGRDEHATLAHRIKADLEARGHQVWFDVDRLQPGGDWELYIEEGLDWVTAEPGAGRVVLLITPHSVRRPDGYCLNEVARALARRLTVIPVMVVWCEPPLSICRIQWLDMTDSVPVQERADRYEARFEQLVAALEEGRLDFEGAQARLLRLLQPLPFDADIAQHLERFTGRRWVFDEIDAWLADPAQSRVFWIMGKPGVGKTAIAAWLCANRREVAALHLCRHGHSQKSDPRKAVLSVAYQLSSQLLDYQDRLNALHLEEAAAEFNARTLFDTLIVQPLSGSFPEPDRPVIILIDALDEATQGGRNELASFIASEFAKTPSWLRLLVTSRPDPEVTQPLQALTPYVLDTDLPQNERDIRHFLERELQRYFPGGKAPDRTLDALFARSEGLFLYAEWACQELAQGRLSLERLDDFPRGLGGIYNQFFERQFGDLAAFRRDTRPALEVIAAAREPVEMEWLARHFDWGAYERREFGASLGSLFQESDGRLQPFHHTTLEWLTDAETAGPFYVDEYEGHQRLAKSLLAAYDSGKRDRFTLAHLVAHLVGANRRQDVATLLTSFEFIQAKCEAGMLNELLADYDQAAILFSGDDVARTFESVQGALCLSAYVIAADPLQTASQLSGRLLGSELPAVRTLLEQAREQHRIPWLRPLLPSLMAPGGALIRTFVGHSGWVDSLAVTLDGCRVVSGSRDGTLKVWDLQTGAELATMRGHKGPVKAVALVPDGCRVVSASDDGTLKVWSLETGTELATLTGHEGPVARVRVTPDGRRAVSASDHGTVRVWDLESGTPLKTLGGNISERNTLARAFLEMIDSGTSGSNLMLRDLQAVLRRQAPGTAPVMAVSRDSRNLVVAVSERALEMHDLESDVEPYTLGDHTGKITSLTITPDGGQVLGGSQDGTLTVWDRSLGEVRHLLRGHAAPVKTVALTPDGSRAISAAQDGTMVVWNLQSGTKLATLTGHQDAVWSVDISYDGRRAVSASSDKTLKVWDLQDAMESATLYGHTDEVWAVALVPDGCRVLSGSWDNTVKLWDLEARGEVQTQIGHAGAVISLAVVPGGRQVVSTSVDKTLRVWDLMSGDCLATLAGHEASVNGVAITPDGRRAISASSDRTLKVWDLASGTELATLSGNAAGIEAVAVTFDGRWVLSGSLDGTLKLWDLRSGAEHARLSGHEGSVSAVIAAPDGRRFVSASYDKTLKVWDVDSRSEIRLLSGHTAGVHSIALTADGHRVVSAANDKTLRIWDLESGDQLVAFSSDSGWAHDVAVMPDGWSIVTVWNDKTLKAWNLENGKFLAGFVSDGAIQSCAAGLDGTTVIAGDDLGRVHFLRLEGTVEGVRLASTAPRAPGLVPVPEGFQLESLEDLEHARLVGSLTDAHRAIREEKWHKAIGYLNAALSLAPELDRALLLKGQCEYWLRRWDEAERTAWRALRTLADRELGEDITEVMPQRLPWFVRVPNRELDAARRQLTQILENLSLARDKDLIEQTYRAMAKEEWTEALGSLDKILSKSPNAVLALYLKAICHFRLEQWDAAEEAARKALPLSATEEHRQAREQLLVLLEQVALVQAQSAMAKGRWTEALNSLQEVRSESPDAVNALPALFLVASCHFRLGEWDAAEQTARKALALCVKEEHEQYQERLLLLLEQTPLARDAQALAQVHMRQLLPHLAAQQFLSRRTQALAPALRAMAKEEWAEALGSLDRFLSKSPNAVPALFLKAMCHFRLEEWDAAEETARRALPFSAAEEHRKEREQLLLILEQTPLVRDRDLFEQAQKAMAKGEWAEALDPLDTILSKAPNLVPLLYYKAICHFKLNEWDAAEEAAKKALPLCTAGHVGIQEQLSLLLEQTALQRAMKMGEFTEASKLLKSIQARRATPAQGATPGVKGESRNTAGLWVARLLVAGMISVALPSAAHPIWHGVLTVIGILSLLIQRSDSIALYWGGALIGTGLLALLLRRRARLVLTGVALLAAGALNAFMGKLGGWTLLAVVQFVLGISALYQSRQRQQPEQGENRLRDTEQ